jgi:hypothetical protein
MLKSGVITAVFMSMQCSIRALTKNYLLFPFMSHHESFWKIKVKVYGGPEFIVIHVPLRFVRSWFYGG